MTQTKSTQEIAQIMNVHPNTILNLVHSGAIPALRVGTQYRFDYDAVRSALQVTNRAKTQSEQDGEGTQ